MAVTVAVRGRPERVALTAGGASLVLLVLVGLAGPSASSPSLGPRTANPAWDLALGLPPGVVVGAEVLAYLLGAVAVWCGLRAVAGGWRPSPARVAAVAVAVVLALVLVPPFGSADHLSYAAYGRIAAQGGDPYVVPPDAWRGGADPVAGAARPPWQDTPSVYGPVATAVQAVASLAGGDSVRLTVWWLQLLAGAGFLVTGLLLDRMARDDAARRARAAVVWTANPVLIGVLVGGAHLDAVCAAAATAALLLAGSARLGLAGPLLGGAAAGAAAGIKLPYAAVAVALAWAFWRTAGGGATPGAAAVRWWLPRVGLLALGVGLVLLPAHLWAGPHVYDQARRASRFTSLASFWRPVMNGLDAVLPGDPRVAVAGLAAVLACVVLLAVAGWAALTEPQPPTGATPLPVRDVAARAALALGVAYLLASPYLLPWYDALAWAPLALVAGGFGLDGLLLVRSATLALAYVPGLVDGTSRAEVLMLDLRQFVAPVVTGAILVRVLARGVRPGVAALSRLLRRGLPAARQPARPARPTASG